MKNIYSPHLHHSKEQDFCLPLGISEPNCSHETDDQLWQHSCSQGMKLLYSPHDGAMRY